MNPRYSLTKTRPVIFAMLLGMSTGFAGSVQSPYEVGTWSGFRPAAISYTFDDDCANQYAIAVPMFNAKGFKLTLFTVTSWQGSWTPVRSAAANGHEIASHTVTHATLSGLSDAQQLVELTNSQNAINANVTTQKCLTLAYPNCTGGNESLTALYYISARNCSGQINPSSPSDFMQISCYICGALGTIQTLQNFTNVANNAATMNGWGVYLIHGIDNDGGYSPLPSAVLQSSVDYFSANTNRYWVQTFGNVTRYIKERNDVSVIESDSGTDSITLDVSGTLDNTIYNYPVTLRRPLPAGWPWAAAAQNGAPVTSQIVTNGAQAYVMFDVVPNGGPVVLSRIESPESQFRVTIPSSATEGDGTLAGQGNITVMVAPTNDLAVSLSSSRTSEATVPPGVTLPAGQTNVVFDLAILDDTLLDGDQPVTITASAPGYGTSQATITVHDNDTATLSVTLPASVSKGAGTLANAGLVSVGTPVSADFIVQLASSGTAKLVVPSTTTILAGQSSATFNLRIVQNNLIDGSQTVTVSAHVPTWTDGSSPLTILDNNAPPDHFAWSLVPSPQLIGEPFAVTITALDPYNNPMGTFLLQVSISALAPNGIPANPGTLLNSPIPEESLFDGDEYVLGYSFTPNANLVVTGVRHYFGDNVSIWTDGGLLLASRNVTSVPGTWVETPLTTPLVLAAGETYRVGVHESAVDYYWSDDLPGTFPDGTINQSWWNYGSAFPDQTDAARWYCVDLVYGTNVTSVTINPGQSASFTNGSWSGNIAALQPASNVVLRASAGPGSSGQSSAFDVLETPKLAIARAGQFVVLSWPAAAAGFTLEQNDDLAAPANWSPVPDGPGLAGDRFTFTNTIGSSNAFYRLSKP